ncbi:uncharacterized protein [Chironomus tepperi]|uniref:uncharacterized protein n=1 Tax=Chironomus tepperi TaxID=113505 RepID=UPI00391FB83C
MSSELNDLIFDDNDVKQFNIICDTLHVNSDLPHEFRGKNLAIYANFVFIHDEYTWNLSGKTVKSYLTDAKRDINGKGNDGRDGLAGQSGGNFHLECKFIENLSLLKIISNGSNGADGQNGGNGKDGNDGKDAKVSDFYVDNQELTVPMTKETFKKLEKSQKFTLEYELYDESSIYYCRGTYVSDDKLNGEFYYRAKGCIVLVYGGDGENGNLGGIGGYGGDAGFPGEITIKSNYLETDLLKYTLNPGIAGKNGHNGWNGVNGRVGGDIYKFHHVDMQSPFIDGLSCPTKFKIDSAPAGWFCSYDITQHQLYSNETKLNIKVEENKEITILTSESCKNDSKLLRSKYSYAIAHKNESIVNDEIKVEHDKTLNESMNEIIDRIADRDEVSANVNRKIKTPMKNPAIDMDSIKKEHINYKEKSFKKIIEFSSLENEYQLDKDQKQNIVNKSQLSEIRVMSPNKKSVSKQYKDCKKVNKTSTCITIDDLWSIKVKKSPEQCIELLKDSNLIESDYKHLIDNIDNLNIEEIDQNLNDEASNQEVRHETKTKSDVIKICSEKYLCTIYKNIYEEFSQNEVDKPKMLKDFTFESPNFSKKMLFLKDTKMFNTKLSMLNNHFNGKFNQNWKEIYKYIANNHKNHNSLIAESIFNHLIANHDKYDEIKTFLIGFKNRIEIFDKEIEDENRKRKNFSNILNEFFDKKKGKVMKIIEKELKKYGNQSTIYRIVVAHKFRYKLVFCRYNLSDSINVFEYHNYSNAIKSRLKIASNEPLEELFILINNNKFSILDFDMDAYGAFKNKENINMNLKQVALILKHIPTKGTKAVQNAFKERKYVKFLTDLKMDGLRFDFSSIFEDGNDLIDIDRIFDNILSKFPKTYYTNENGKFVLYEIGDKQFDETKTKLEILYERNDDEERLKVKKLFGLITDIGGLSIIKAINIKLENSKNSFNLPKFLTVLTSILKILMNNEDFVISLTFMILGLDQNLWIPELIFIKLAKFKYPDLKKDKWRQILREDKLRNVVWIFLEKLLNLNDDSDMWTASEFDKIIKNLDYYDDNICEIIQTTNLNVWSEITTDAYWDVQFEKLKLNYEFVDDDLKTIFEDISNMYGIKAKKLLDIYISKGREIAACDLKTFTRNFTSGIWIFSDEVLTFLDKQRVSSWNNRLKVFFNTDRDIITANEIIDMMKKGDETSVGIKNKMNTIQSECDEVKANIEKFKSFDNDKLFNESKSSKNPSKLLAIIISVIKNVAKVELRDTQIIAILTMYHSDSGVLMQVSTGEGKTFIGVAFAILKVLLNENVDIVTSSTVLAKRDATNNINKKIFFVFDIKVDHNCHEKPDERKKAYDCQIVYGTLCNFQRDYLLTEFHEEKIMLNHQFKNILVDEVDSMLLDKGNNILYLSQHLPDLDEIDNIFIFIWKWLNHQKSQQSYVFDKQLLRQAILDNVYGILNYQIIDKMCPNIDSAMVLEHLKNLKIIDENDLIVAENIHLIKSNKIKCAWYSDELFDKIYTYCDSKTKSEFQLKIPNHLKSFVLQHLNSWIDSGIRALYLDDAKEYIIDIQKSALVEEDPNVNIIDLDTGTDMKDSQWDEGLHQFIQIKYGCKLSPISLKSVFISNVSFFKKYSKTYGMTGTLGCLLERQKLTKIHHIDFVTIPRHVTRKFKEYIPIVKSTRKEWIESIHEEIQSKIDNNQSVLVICKTIQDTQLIQKDIKVPKKRLLLYQRDTENLDIKKLEPGYVILSTNLAGRGTDIKSSEQLNNNGGLHVILTNLPDNSRIEEQAFGRTARSGENGTARMIIWTDNNKPVSKLKELRNQNELSRLDEIATYYEHFIKIEEEFFEKFQKAYKTMKDEKMPNKKVFLLNLLINWSFWLDSNSKLLEDWKNKKSTEMLHANFEKFLNGKKELHPIMRIELLKELVGGNNRSNKNQIAISKLLDGLSTEDDLLATMYSKVFEIFKSNFIYNYRELKGVEIEQIRKCIKMIKSQTYSRQIAVEMIKYSKTISNLNVKPINGYEKQQKEILEIYDELLKSLKILMGEDIYPETLRSTQINTFVLQNQLYHELLDKNCIKPPKLSDFYSKDDLKEICRKYNLDFHFFKIEIEKLKKDDKNFLKTFEESIRKNKDFALPNRLEFWNILLKKEILKHEIKYAILDMDAIKDVDPSAEDIIRQECNEFNTFTRCINLESIYFSPIDKSDIDSSKFVIKDDNLQSLINPKRYNYLIDHNVIEINMKATFDVDQYRKLSESVIFGKFDRIKTQSMEIASCNYQKVVNKLIDLDILKPDKSTQTKYALVCDNLEKLNDQSILDDDFVYHTNVDNFLRHNFAYTIALESLIKDIQNKVDAPIIRLEINPYANLITDLFENFIIDHSKVDETKINECKNLFKNFDERDIFDINDLKTYKELKKELKERGLIDANDNIVDFDKNKFTFSGKYVKIEKTSLLMLQNRRTLLEEVKNIKQFLKSCVKPLKRTDLDSNDIVLMPIDQILPENGYLHFMKLKGLGSVIKIKENYSSTVWSKLGAVFALTIFTVYVVFYCLYYKTVPFFGLNQAYYIFSKLRQGHFNWDSFKTHKSKIVSNLLIQFANCIKNSNQKWLKMCSSPIKEIAKHFKNKEDKNQNQNETKTFEQYKMSIIRSECSSRVYPLIHDYMNRIFNKIINDISKTIKEEFNNHNVKNNIKDLMMYLNTAELKALIQEEYPEIQNIFAEVKCIYKHVLEFVESLTNSTDNSIEKVSASVNSISEKALIHDSVKKMFDHINKKLEKVLKSKQNSKTLDKQNIDKFNRNFIEHIESVAKQQTEYILNTQIIKPAMTHIERTINDKNYKNIRKLMHKNNNDSSKLDDMTLYQEINAINSFDNHQEDLIKKSMHIHSHANDYKQFRRLMLKNRPYDEIFIEIIRLLLENTPKNKDPISISVIKNGNTFNFGPLNCKDTNKYVITYPAVDPFWKLIGSRSEYQNHENIDELINFIINKNPNIKKAITAYNNGFYKDFNNIDSQMYMFRTENEYGSYEDLKQEYHKLDNIEVVQIPTDKAYYTKHLVEKSEGDLVIAGIALPKQIYNSMTGNKNWKKFEEKQDSYAKSNEFEKSITMQFIQQHNIALSIPQNDIRKLHSNQEKLIDYLLDERIINEDKKKYLVNIVEKLSLNRTKEVYNEYI